jgi:MATE family multidrug resistance protein
MTTQTDTSGARPRWDLSAGLNELLKLAWPVVLARLGIMTMGLTDMVVVGHYSAQQLGFHALGWAPTTIVLGAAVGLLQGVQVMTARHIGEGRPQAVGGVLRRGLVYGLWVGALSVAILCVAGPWFLHVIGLDPTLADGASRALLVFAWSLPFYFVANVCIFFLEALAKPKPGMIAMWVANAVNLAANLWLVPGHSGLPVEGAVAAGWATFIARGALAAWLIIYIWKLPRARELGVFAPPIDGPEAAIEQRRIGYGAGASMFIEIGAFSAMTLIAGQIGGLEAAAWSSVLNVTAIVFMGPLGLSAATSVLVGRAYGARDGRGVVRAGLLGFGVTVALTILVCLVVGPGARLIALGYTHDAALVGLIAPGLLLTCLFYIPDGLQVVAAQALRARDDVWLPTACHLFSYAVVMVPLGFWFAHGLHMGVNGLVWAVIIASFISGGLLVGRFLLLARRPLG